MSPEFQQPDGLDTPECWGLKLPLQSHSERRPWAKAKRALHSGPVWGARAGTARKATHHLHELAHSSSRFSFRLLPAGQQPLPQTKQWWGQTCCLPRATETTEAQTVQLPASGSRKFPHAPGGTRKGSASAFWQGPCRTEHPAFGRRDSALSLMFISYFVSLPFPDSVQLRQGTGEGSQAKLESVRGAHGRGWGWRWGWRQPALSPRKRLEQQFLQQVHTKVCLSTQPYVRAISRARQRGWITSDSPEKPTG